jgi:uncharacterized membrane protein
MSEKFRYQLRTEARQWQAEGLIEAETYEKLAQRYQFEELDETAQNRFITILLGLGSVLLGLAIITLVAANWQGWTRSRQIIILVSAFMSANTAGFYLWQSRQQSWKTFLGKGLLLLAALLLGANLALMSQIFHLSGSISQLYLVWGVGVLGMAYSLRLTFLGLVTIILMTLGYGFGVPQLLRSGVLSGFQLVVQHMPLFSAFIFIPLAYWCQSRWIFGLGWILSLGSLEINLAQQLLKFVQVSTPITAMTAVVACILPPGLLWAYQGSLWRQQDDFDRLARRLAIVFLSVIFYCFSFNFMWQGSLEAVNTKLSQGDWLTFLDAGVLSLIAISAWIHLGKQRNPPFWRITLTNTLVALSLGITGSLVWWHLTTTNISVVTVVVFNLLLFALSVGLLRHGTLKNKRRSFWGGVILLALQIFTRMVEYDTNLIAKAVVLFITGIAIILGGIWFEKFKKN